MKFRSAINNFINSPKEYGAYVIIASGLYPFLHYYNNNLSIADSFIQFSLLFILCVLMPIGLYFIGKKMVQLKVFTIFRSSYLSILNVCVFSFLLGFLIFRFNKKELLVLFIVSFIIGIALQKHIKKIVILQILLAVISMITLMPKIWFAIDQNNSDWALIPKPMLDATFKYSPNIFIIQPDGYANSKDLRNPPYSFDNSDFEDWLQQKGLIVYEDFRSNYYSTLTSNSSMFAMKHHYYSNTNRSTLKTYNANNIIVGDENNVLKILKKKNYKTFLLTDNSYFLANRRPLYYDYCNVDKSEVHYFEPRDVYDIDLLSDFKTVLDTLSTDRNFFFVEKTIPSHINHNKHHSKGKNGEREIYLEKVKLANQWLKELIEDIEQFDSDALIVIVADHGGYVGLDYTLEVNERRLDSIETISAFTSMLSIKWPNGVEQKKLDFKSNVNLFHNLFYALSEDEIFIKNRLPDKSFLPLQEKGRTIFYECIDNNQNVVFKPID